MEGQKKKDQHEEEEHKRRHVAGNVDVLGELVEENCPSPDTCQEHANLLKG